MKPVPKHIQDKMHRIAKLSHEVEKLSLTVDEWFEAQGCHIFGEGNSCERSFGCTAMRCGDGYSLEELEYGTDVTDIIIERYMSGEFTPGRIE